MLSIPRKYANLRKDDLNKIQALEKELGKVLVAYENDSPFAQLSEEQIENIRQLENELDVILVAFKP